MENSIKDIPKNEIERTEREEKEFLARLETNFVNLIFDSNDDEIYLFLSLNTYLIPPFIRLI